MAVVEVVVEFYVSCAPLVAPACLNGVFFWLDLGPLLGGFMAFGPEFALPKLPISGSLRLLLFALLAAAYVVHSKSHESPDRVLKEERQTNLYYLPCLKDSCSLSSSLLAHSVDYQNWFARGSPDRKPSDAAWLA